MNRKFKISVLLAIATAVCTTTFAQPYTITVQPISGQSPSTPALQSFCYASYKGLLLIVGGRTNGFHRTSTQESTFPTKFDNNNFVVLDPTTGNSYSAPVPAEWLPFLHLTNMQSYQDGTTLYLIGGYGSTCSTDSAGCYQTFPNLTCIDVAGLVTAVINGTGNLGQYMVGSTDERLRVTGGSLHKLGDWFYLVFGQNYNSIYKGGVTGIYTEEIRKFQIGFNGSNIPFVQNYQAITTPAVYAGVSQFHRRDLNVVPAINPADGSLSLTAYGGVFTPTAGPFPNPIMITQDGQGNTRVKIDNAFQQRFALYECATVQIWDPAVGGTYTSFLGGITNYYYDKTGRITPSGINNYMPFFNHVSTIVRSPQGVSAEYPQYLPALPGYIGANAVFIANPGVQMQGNPDIIDYSTIAAGAPVLIGWMYGGIKATAEQASEFNPTFSNGTIYSVYLQKNNAFKMKKPVPKQKAPVKKTKKHA
jgi:hypothetical protein